MRLPSVLCLALAIGACGVAQANHLVPDPRDGIPTHELAPDFDQPDELDNLPASPDQVELTTPCIIEDHGDRTLGWCALEEAYAPREVSPPAEPWYCTARSALGRAFNGMGESREEARAAALDECQAQASFCYVSRCRSEVYNE